MLTEEFKSRLRTHIVRDFEQSVSDGEVTDGIIDSIYDGLNELVDEVSENDQDEFYYLVDEIVEELVEHLNDE